MTYEPPSFDARRLSRRERIRLLEAKVAFLLDEVSGLRTVVRHLAAANREQLPQVQQTRDSFDYQWRDLPEGHAMLSNPDWKAAAADKIIGYTGLPREWFRGKRVLDADAGRARDLRLRMLETASCVAIDVSPAAIERTTGVAKAFGDRVAVYQKDLLQNSSCRPISTCLVLRRAAPHGTISRVSECDRCVKPGGYLFLMIYAEPRRDRADAYEYHHDIVDMRSRVRNLAFGEKVTRVEQKYGKAQLHGYFDAISPEINDLYRWDELVSWVLGAGFEDARRTAETWNHCLIARRKD